MTHPPAGPSTPPPPSGPRVLTAARRMDNYRQQTGRPILTPRQWRRITHKVNRAVGHGLPL